MAYPIVIQLHEALRRVGQWDEARITPVAERAHREAVAADNAGEFKKAIAIMQAMLPLADTYCRTIRKTSTRIRGAAQAASNPIVVNCEEISESGRRRTPQNVMQTLSQVFRSSQSEPAAPAQSSTDARRRT